MNEFLENMKFRNLFPGKKRLKSNQKETEKRQNSNQKPKPNRNQDKIV